MRTSAPSPRGKIRPAAVPQGADRLLEQAIRRGWRSLVGPEVARRTQPGTLSGGGLQVVVDNSPWCQEITLRSPEILAALAREFGPARVRSLKVTLGRLDADPRPALREPAPPEHRVTDAERRTIDALLTPIADRDLRDSMRRLLVKTRRFA